MSSTAPAFLFLVSCSGSVPSIRWRTCAPASGRSASLVTRGHGPSWGIRPRPPRPLTLWVFFLIGMGPIALDGGSQFLILRARPPRAVPSPGEHAAAAGDHRRPVRGDLRGRLLPPPVAGGSLPGRGGLLPRGLRLIGRLGRGWPPVPPRWWSTVRGPGRRGSRREG